MAGYISLGRSAGMVRFMASSLDSEYLAAMLFGVCTGIPGLDQLFGGFGPFMCESVRTSPQGAEGKGALPPLSGRSICVTGGLGTGKTSLALRIAVEVARLRGIAWYVSVEQPPSECVYTLQALGCDPLDDTITLATTLQSAREALDEYSRGRCDKGILIVLHPGDKNDYSGFLATCKSRIEQIGTKGLRLLAVDPISGVGCTCDESGEETSLRSLTLELFHQAKSAGVNLLLLLEEAERLDRHTTAWNSTLRVLEYVSDSVVRLSIRRSNEYAQRYIELSKSRLQREQRGEHPFSIRAGAGLEVYPSPASVAVRLRERGPISPNDGRLVRFGLLGMDKVLGTRALYEGDVIAFHGAGGSLKTPIGLFFLTASTRSCNSQPPLSLLFSIRDSNEAVRHLFDGLDLQSNRSEPAMSTSSQKRYSPTPIRFCRLPSGHTTPGRILSLIEQQIGNARREGYRVERVMIDDVEQWDMSSEMVRDDVTFPGTLVELLRKKRVTALIVCGDSEGNRDTGPERSLVNLADCVVDFGRIEFRGMRRIVMRVSKTRDKQHNLETWEVLRQDKTICVEPRSSLLRTTHDGAVVPVMIRFLMHVDSAAQVDYYDSFCESVRKVLSPEARFECQDRLYLSTALSLGKYSAADELQILQLDEFQLAMHTPRAGDDYLGLYEFDTADVFEDGTNRQCWLPGFGDGIFCSSKSHSRTSVRAFPFIANVSLLCYDPGNASFQPEHGSSWETTIGSWAALAQACHKWEEGHLSGVFFDFPKATPENYNCLFLEILLSLEKPCFVGDDNTPYCPLRGWLNSEAAREAGKLFWRLCRRAYGMDATRTQRRASRTAEESSVDDLKQPLKVRSDAIVWRHWYTTLTQLIHDVEEDAAKVDRLVVCPLPGNVAIAGQWYLGIPKYSAAPHVGLQLIKRLTSREAELTRARKGVGLPTYSYYYAASANIRVSSFMSLRTDMAKQILDTAFRRSSFLCYHEMYNTLADRLQGLLAYAPREETVWEDDPSLDAAVAEALGAVVALLDFRQCSESSGGDYRSERCRRCRSRARCSGTKASRSGR